MARVRTPSRRRIPVCRTCLDLLDAVVAEWWYGELEPHSSAPCVACGGEPELWVAPDRRGMETASSIDIDATETVIVVSVSGELDGRTMRSVATEIAGFDAIERPVVLDLSGVTSVEPAGLVGLEAAAARASAAGGRVGIVARATWVGDARLEELDGVEIVAPAIETVIACLRTTIRSGRARPGVR